MELWNEQGMTLPWALTVLALLLVVGYFTHKWTGPGGLGALSIFVGLCEYFVGWHDQENVWFWIGTTMVLLGGLTIAREWRRRRSAGR